jgi:XTP/dITP diphosphohydrolase
VPQARFASRNPHKVRELQALLPGWEVEALERDDYPAETGHSYYENALAKARFGWEPGTWSIGEDSGVEVAALGGAPGVHSSRAAAGDEVGWVLRELGDEEDRRARYVSELVAIAPDGAELRGSGNLSGTIARQAAGEEGFGFDPVFVPVGETQTVAQLGNEWKSRNSHRARAAAALLTRLNEALERS